MISRSCLAVACLTAVLEVLGSNRAVGSCVYRKNHCDLQPWARDVWHCTLPAVPRSTQPSTMGGATSFKPCMLISSPSTPLPSPSLPSHPILPSIPFPPFPSRVEGSQSHLPSPLFSSPPSSSSPGVPPRKPARGSGERYKLPQWAPADKRFGAYLGQKEQLWWQQFLCISLE